ncbi:hypothetical protein [Vreelandella titanicae]|uniref:Uncharacterized protein n=1 Tax=Vreelandella titanicae TaxID=664683 RepID=A0A558J8D8_9GAMM|nr:hypothetical protein [Halomonas titanicae]TVU89782.1 hypothetical protein FQP89_10615 [Halomonas titanicae]
MSEQPNPKDYYADTAYKPAKRVAWEEANPGRQRKNGSCLGWQRRTQDNGTKEEYGYNNISISLTWEARRAETGGINDDVFNNMKVRYDQQSIMPPNFKTIANIIFTMMAIGKGGMFLSIFVLAVSFVLISIMAIFNGRIKDSFLAIIGMAELTLPIALILLLLWKGCELLTKKHPTVLGARKGPLWQLNRQNGFFTIYNPKRAWKERLVAPIYEFDAYLESSPDTQGSPTYSLMLFHPETGLRQKLDAQFPPTNMPGELVAAWQFIQRYMDVSQPLPDVPALEIHRHKDPTTAAADQRKGRNPRYWRDMSEAEVEKIQEEKYQKNIRLR